MKLLNVAKLKNNIEEIAKYDFDNQKVFGSAYFVMQNGETVYENCFGTVSVSGAPVTSSTVFRLASMTKPITGIAVLLLKERELIDLDDPVTKYLPEFKGIHVVEYDGAALSDKGITPVMPTIRHMLTHTSGIGSEQFKLNKLTAEDKQTVDASIKFYIENGLDFVPGTRLMYSPTGAFDVLTKIIETVSGTDYLSFLENEIFKPLGMNDTTFIPTDEQWARMITMHNKENGVSIDAPSFDGCVFVNFPCTHFLGGAGLVSTLSDYSKFAAFLLNGGKGLLKPETFKEYRTPQIPHSLADGNETWGLSVRVIHKEEYGVLPVGTYGWSGAFGTHFFIDPVNNIAAVFLKNSYFDGGAANESARMFEKAVESAFI